MDAEDIERLVKNLRLTNDAKEMAVKIMAEEEGRARARADRVVVGKIFNRRLVNRDTLRFNLPKIFRARGRTEVEIVGHNLFIVSFSLETDKRMALEEGPWHFFNSLMILKQIEFMQTPQEVEFDEITLWVQFHNVPIACMDSTIIKRLGERVGRVEEVEVGEGSSTLGRIARARVTRSIQKPLLRCVTLSDEQQKQEVLVLLQYEKLPEFCYVCGCLGHISKECEEKTSDTNMHRYDDWIKAGSLTGGWRRGGDGSRGQEKGGVRFSKEKERSGTSRDNRLVVVRCGGGGEGEESEGERETEGREGGRLTGEMVRMRPRCR